MTLHPLRLLSFAIIFDITLGQWTMAGRSHSFTFVTPKIDSGHQMLWVLQTGIRNESLFLCNSFFQSSCDPYSDMLLELYSANITSNSTSYTSIFTIKNVTPFLHNTTWFCVENFPYLGQKSGRFELHVFATPETPTCDYVTLLNEIYLQINCQTHKTFPDTICIFYVRSNNASAYELRQGSITYAHELNSTSGYYKANCTYIVSASILGLGSHMFRVVMYPNITSNITEEMKTTSQYTNSIQINFPKAVLGPDCHVGNYIKENETKTCTCFDNSTGFLPTRVTWCSVESNNGTLTFTAKRPSKGEMNFQCMVSNTIYYTNKIIYKPKVAYPPLINLTLLNSELDICLDSNSDIVGNCFVSDGYPESTVSIYINNILLNSSHVYDTMNNTFTSAYKMPGVVNVTCLAYNTEYSLSTTRNVTIKGPPEAPNVFVLLRQDTASSAEITQQAVIMCRSRGGFPTSKQLSLKCGTVEAQATNSDTVALEVNITRTPSDVNCTCVVLHESKCLRNTTTKFLTLYEHICT
ncbi:unnamed protein product [Lymnaea stagnalis]|uniref:Ig-like domain-containing protein n=1 Tax=Lymnaea stagnalis TaxID=6523 RepID=A0AAV2I9G1_LYMST